MHTRTSAKIIPLIALAVFIFALLLRCWHLDAWPRYYEDEFIHVPAATAYVSNGLGPLGQWAQPRLCDILIASSMNVFGDNPYGWRMRNALFGGGIAALLFLIARRHGGNTAAALAGAALIATDPLHILYSRTTHMEIQVTFFFLLFLWIAQKSADEERDLFLPLALVIGLAVSSKAYFTPAMGLISTLLLYRSGKRSGFRSPAFINNAILLAAVPVTIYLLTYAPWFLRGYSLEDFLSVRRYCIAVDTVNLEFIAEPSNPQRIGSTPLTWFLHPLNFGYPAEPQADGLQAFRLKLSSPAWFLFVPAFFISLGQSIRTRSFTMLSVHTALISICVMILATDRTVFIYSILPLLPLVYLAILDAFRRISAGFTSYRIALAAVTLLLIGMNIYLYPLATYMPVSPAFYEPALSRATLYERELP